MCPSGDVSDGTGLVEGPQVSVREDPSIFLNTAYVIKGREKEVSR